MPARHRKKLECMSAPVIAYLIDVGYVANDGGILEVTSRGYDYLREGIEKANNALTRMVSQDEYSRGVTRIGVTQAEFNRRLA